MGSNTAATAGPIEMEAGHMHLLWEFCAENMEHLPAAISTGAGRIELCDNLAVGGTTPSFGVIRAAVALGRTCGVPIMAMIRPRGGDFLYTPAEGQIMCDDLLMARRLGVHGVVFGCLTTTPDGNPILDRSLTEQLVGIAREPVFDEQGHALADARITFHMAFDALDEGRQREAIDILADLGVERVLTHGGPLASPIEDHLDHLRELIAYADGRIRILPGGGITCLSAPVIARALGVDEVHGTKVVLASSDGMMRPEESSQVLNQTPEPVADDAVLVGATA